MTDPAPPAHARVLHLTAPIDLTYSTGYFRPRLLWTKRAATWPAASAPVKPICSLEPDQIVCREANGGLVQRWLLPFELREPIEQGHVKLLVSSERFALLVGFRSYGLIVTWSEHDQPVVLERPMIFAREKRLVGHTLHLFDETHGVESAYDLTRHDPPFASLAPEAALAAAGREAEADAHHSCARLYSLEQLGPTWLDVIRHPEHELFGCALNILRDRPEPGAAAILRELASRQRQDGVDYRWSHTLTALAADDSLETSQYLADLVRELSSATPPAFLRPSLHSWALDRAHDQLWRTGRTSELGLCPRRGRPRRLPELSRPAADGSIGTAHPLFLTAIAPDGRWCVVCQARRDTDRDGTIEVSFGRHGDNHGDELKPYLVVGSGEGAGFDEFIAKDPTGRYAALREGACLSIVDTATGEATTLPDADLRHDRRLGTDRVAAFAPSGSRMLYLRSKPRSVIVLRDLESGREQAIDPGPGLVYSARFDQDERWIVARISDGWPEFWTNAGESSCGGGDSEDHFIHFGLSTRLIELDGTVRFEGEEVVMPFGTDAMVRRKDGALVVRRRDGFEKPLVPPSCHGSVWHADPYRSSVLARCARDLWAYPGELWLFDRQGAKRLGKLWRPAMDRFNQPFARLIDADDYHVDLEARALVPNVALAATEVRRTNDDDVLARRGDGAVLTRKRATSLSGPLVWRQR